MEHNIPLWRVIGLGVVIVGGTAYATIWDVVPLLWGGRVLPIGTDLWGVPAMCAALAWLGMGYVQPPGGCEPRMFGNLRDFLGFKAAMIASLPIGLLVAEAIEPLRSGAASAGEASAAILAGVCLLVPVACKVFIWSVSVGDYRAALAYLRRAQVPAKVEAA